MLDVFKDREYEDAYRDAVTAVLKDQELAGLDIVTDGKMSYDDYRGGTGWFQYTLERTGGLSGREQKLTSIFKGHPLAVIQEMASAYGAPVCSGALTRGPYRLTEQFRIAQQLTSRPIKVNIGDPGVIATMPIHRGHEDSWTNCLLELNKIFNAEFRDLEAAGCKMIQTDTSLINILPNFEEVSSVEFNMFVQAFNEMMKGIRMEKWLHVCWGRLHGQPLLGAGAVRAWDKAFPHLIDTSADTINMHMSYAGDDVLKILKEYPTDKNIALGVIDISTLIVEKPEKVKDFALKAANYVDPKKLYFTTDCGLITVMDRVVAQYKLMSLVQGVQLARKELKVEEVPPMATVK